MEARRFARELRGRPSVHARAAGVSTFAVAAGRWRGLRRQLLPGKRTCSVGAAAHVVRQLAQDLLIQVEQDVDGEGLPGSLIAASQQSRGETHGDNEPGQSDQAEGDIAHDDSAREVGFNSFE